MPSVIVEKEPNHCLVLFCYLDAIGEAHSVYSGLTWLRHNGQFQQCKVVRPFWNWDHKHISLWINSMNSVLGISYFKGAWGFICLGTTGQ